MSTLETLQEILIKNFALTREQVVPDAALARLGVDSLGVLELMFEIEDRFHLKITGDTPTDLATIEDVVCYIDGLLTSKPTSGAASTGQAADSRCVV